MKQSKKIIFTILLFCLLTILLKAEIEIFGYFENRFFLVDNTLYKWSDFNHKFTLSDYNRLRLKFKAKPSDKATLNFALDFFTFHGQMSSPLGTVTENGGESDSSNLRIDLDRAYVDLYFKHFDVSIGKQRIAMGVSYLWAPLDVFNRVNMFEPKEEKPGANAVKVYVPLGSSSGLTGVWSPEKNFNYSKSGIRFNTQTLGIDMGLTFIHSGETGTAIYGIDLRGENFIGWWVEGGYYRSPLVNYFKVVVGFDYTFPVNRGLYWLNEFFYDSGGEEDIANYDYKLLSSLKRFTLGQKYFFSMLRYSFSDFLSASLSYIGNLSDGSFILNPNGAYEISQNVQLALGLYLPMGKQNSEFGRIQNNIFFMWLKVNF